MKGKTRITVDYSNCGDGAASIALVAGACLRICGLPSSSSIETLARKKKSV